MEQAPAAAPDQIELREYSSWRNKYAAEQKRCREYEGRFAGKPGRKIQSWLDGRMVLRALASVQPGSSILDMPCGGGRMTRTLSSAGFRPVAVDFSPWMVLESLPSARAGVRADGLRLPFRDRAFPAAICFRFLHSVPAAFRIAALRELARVADLVVLNYLNALSLRNIRCFLTGGRVLKNRMTEAQAISEVESAGIRVKSCRYKSKLLCEDFVVVGESPAPAERKPPPTHFAEGGNYSSALRDLLER